MDFFDVCFAQGGVLGLALMLNVPLVDLPLHHQACLSYFGRWALLLMLPAKILCLTFPFAPIFLTLYALSWLVPKRYRSDALHNRKAAFAAAAYLALAAPAWRAFLLEFCKINDCGRLAAYL